MLHWRPIVVVAGLAVGALVVIVAIGTGVLGTHGNPTVPVNVGVRSGEGSRVSSSDKISPEAANVPRDGNHEPDLAVLESLRAEAIADIEKDDIQKHRIDGFVKVLQKESLVESLARLSEEEQYMYPGVSSYRKRGEEDIETILSSRRVLKVLSELKALPREEAARRVKESFQANLTACRETVEYLLRTYRDPSLPKNTRSMLGNKGGLCASVWLVGQFAGAPEAADAMDQAAKYEQWVNTQVSSPDYDPLLGTVIRKYNLLQDRFRVNVLLHAIQSDAGDQAAQLPVQVAQLKTEEILLLPYDAKLTWYDWAHMREQQPLDASAGGKALTLYDWDSAATNKAGILTAVLAAARKK